MKKYLATCLLASQFFNLAIAHDGPHGPEINDGGKFGGQVVAAIILEKEEGHKGHDHKNEKAPEVKYKVEFVRDDAQMVKAYLYDTKMKTISLDNFPKQIEAVFETNKKGKKEAQSFKLEKKNNRYEGQGPKPKSRPFAIEIQFTADGENYFAGLENQD